jgi:hypothetical protein
MQFVVDEPSAEEQLRQVEGLLDEGVGREGVEDLTLVERVADVIEGFKAWTDLAIRRLHELHRSSYKECPLCSKWLDRSAE